MALLPQNQRDQVKIAIGFIAIALAAVYYSYPYSMRDAEIMANGLRLEQLTNANTKAEKEFKSGSLETLREQAAASRATLTVMRRLVPTGNEVPALLEEVSTAARRAGLDIGGVVPEAVIPGERFDTYRYKITIIGGYHQFGAFLANVGSLPRIVAPVTFQLATGNGAGVKSTLRPNKTSDRTGLESVITLQTYVERTAPEPKAGGKRVRELGS
jgi:type IV pilus assembly protein PilO